MATSSKKSTSISKSIPVKSTGSAAVKALQTSLNKKGANLKVDGIQGKLTNAAIAKFGSSSTSKTSSSTTSNKTTTPINKKTPILGNPMSGGFFNNLKGGIKMAKNGIKDAINTVNKKSQTGAVLNATLNPTYVDKFGNTKNVQLNPSGYTGNERDSNANGSNINKLYNTISNNMNNDYTKPKIINSNNTSSPVIQKDPTSLDSKGNYNSTQGGQVFNPDGTPMTIYNAQNSSSSNTTSTTPETTKTTTTTNPDGTQSKIVTTGLSTPTAFTSPNTISYTGISGAEKAILGINNDSTALQGQGSAWSYDNGKTLINNRIDSWTDGIAKNFKTAEDFTNAYQTNPSFKSKVDSLNQYNITPSSIANKIQINSNITDVNGIQPVQSTQDYLASIAGVPKINSGDKTTDKLLTEEALLTQGWSKQMIEMYKGDHDTVGILEQDKIDAQNAIDNLNEKISNKEASVKEKAQYEIDKATHEFNKADAELEINRVNAKNSMIGLLASLGALDTSGAAGNAILVLDQKYQAQKQDLRSSYDMGVREIRMNMNDNINSLEENLNDNIIKINSDLSKSDREINLEIMKLTHETAKDMLSIKEKAASKLQAQKDKAESKALALSNDWTNKFFTATAGDYFKSLPKEFVSQWMTNAPSWGAGTTSNKTDLMGNQGLMQDYSNWSKNNPNTGKNYTASNIPDAILSSVEEDIQAGAPLKDLIALYPEISTSYLNTLVNQK